MPKSMTGYGAAIASSDEYNVSVEIKSINHRFLELSFRSGRSIIAWEDNLRQIIRSKVARGKLEIYIAVEYKGDKQKKLKVNKSLASEYNYTLTDMAAKLNLKPVTDVLSLALLPEVLEVVEVESLTEAQTLAVEAVNNALNKLVQMREYEGEKLAGDIRQRLTVLEQATAKIEEIATEIVTNYEVNLRQKIQEHLSSSDIDETRIVQEVAILADKVNVTEEIVRLCSHLGQARELLIADTEPLGRKLDFIIQEINREINTIGSKANNIVVSKLVIDMKSEVEKIREQVQNLE